MVPSKGVTEDMYGSGLVDKNMASKLAAGLYGSFCIGIINNLNDGSRV